MHKNHQNLSNNVPTLFDIPGLLLHKHWQHTQTNAAIYCETHCGVVTELVAFGFGWHLDLKKDDQLELSVSPQLLCCYCSGKFLSCCQALWLLQLVELDASCSTNTSHKPVSSQRVCLYCLGKRS